MNLAEAVIETEAAIKAFRQNIAERYARILYGNHLRNAPMFYPLPHALAGVPFSGVRDQDILATMICDYLASLTRKEPATVHIAVIKHHEANCFFIIGQIKHR
jgi:hypothetical protein